MDDIPAPRREGDGDQDSTFSYHPEWDPPFTAHPGERWRNLLDARGMSQAALAETVGSSAKHINQILKGKALPSADLVIAMADVLDVQAKLMWQLQANHLFHEALVRRLKQRVKS